MSIHIKQFVNSAGVVVEATQIEEARDLVQLRAKDDWSEGQLLVLTYPTADPEGWVGSMSPVSMFGKRVTVGNWLVKGPAGDIEVVSDGEFQGSDFEEKVA